MGVIPVSLKPQDPKLQRTRDRSGEKNRLRREDCEHVKHDRLFSSWKILVGPSDWKEHAAGKEGIDRYRLHNLPGSHFGPGVYELGVTAPAWLPSPYGRSARNLKRQDVVVVYVGQAENIRQRLQRYGQTGAHLEGSSSSRLFLITNDSQSGSCKSGLRTHGMESPSEENLFPDVEKGSPHGPRLFSEVFALGCSIVFRWAATDSKVVAAQVESELLSVFDYAWNRGRNGARRSRDVLAKLFLGLPGEKTLCGWNSSGKKSVLFGSKRVGITVAVQKPVEGSVGLTPASDSKVGDFSFLLQNLPQLLSVGSKGGKQCEFTKLEVTGARCGVLLDNGIRCNTLPVKGRKRCLMHKGMKARGQAQSSTDSQCFSQVTSAGLPGKQTDGVQLDDGGKQESDKVTVCGSVSPIRSLCLPLAGKGKKQPISQTGRRPRSLSFNSWMKAEDMQNSEHRGER